MLNFRKSLLGLSKVFCFIFFPAIFATAQFNPTDAARGFNVITSGNFRANGDVEGGVAIGGRLTIYANVQINMHSSGTETFKDVVGGNEENRYVGLIVQNGVTYTAGKVDVQNSRYVKIKDLQDSKRYFDQNDVYQKKIVHQNATNDNVFIGMGTDEQSETSLRRDVSNIFNFTSIFNEFQTYSDALKNSTANAEIESYDSGNKYRFKLIANQTNIINLTKSQLYTISSKGELGWTMVPSATTPVVINVDMQGGDFDWNNKPNMMVNGVSTGHGEFVLWNFHNGNGKILKLNGSSYLIGSVYALGISVEKYEGYVEGQIVAKDFYQNGGEVHYKRFKTTVTPPTPYSCSNCESKNLVDWTFNKWIPDSGSPFQNDGSYYVLNNGDVNSDYYVRQEILPASLIQPGRPYKYTVEMTSHANGGSGRVAEMYLEFYDGSTWTATTGESVNTNYPNFVTKTISGNIPPGTTRIRVVGHSKGNALKFKDPNLVICFNNLVVNNLTKTDPDCLNQGGIINVTTAGGSGQLKYRIKKGSGSFGAWQNSGSSYQFINLDEGTYTVEVEDQYTTSDNCKGSKTITLTKSLPSTATAAATNPTCAGPSVNTDGKIALSGFDGSDRYDYNTGSTYTGGKTYATATAIPGGGVIVSNLPNPSDPSQSYTVRIFNSSGCYIDRTVTLTKVSCDCPVVAEPVVGDGSRCGTGTGQVTIATNCVSGSSLKIFSNSGLTTDVTGQFTISGSTITSPSVSSDVTYYAVCVHDTWTTCKSAGDDFKLTINNIPAVTVKNSGKITCISGSVITAEATPNTGITYTWTVPLGASDPGDVASFTATVPGTYTVKVKVNATDCESTSESTTVTEDKDLPTVILETSKLTCAETKVTVVAAATPSGVTYKWTVPALATDPGDVASFETSVPGVYSVEVTAPNGCKATDQIEVMQDKDVPTVTVNDKVIGCDESEATLTAEGTAGVTYSWTGPGIFTADTKEISVSVAGTYKVTVTSLVNGCTATDEGVVTKKDKPGPPTSGPHKVCYGEQITLVATCASGTAKWYSDALLTQEITVLTFIPQQTHTYYAVCATQDCVSEPTQSVVTVTPDFPAPELEANPEEVIAGQNSTLSGTCQTGTLVWYKDAGLTQVLGTGATLVVTPETTTTYYAACEVEDCKKPSEIIVKVKDGIFDLALRKTVKPGQKTIFKPGDEVTFNITVFNQGNVDATNIDLVDYIPTGLTLSDANWVLDGTKARWAGAIPSLTAGADATVSITFTLNDDAVGLGVIINTAEISGAENDKGLEDIDSTPDDIKDNDGVVKNDEINEDGKKGGDEDDHDIEPIPVCSDQTCLKAKAKVKK